MKKQLQSFLLFVAGLCVSGMAYGQTGTFNLDTMKTSKFPLPPNSPYTFSGVVTASPYAIRVDTMKKNNWSRYWMLNVDTKPVMTISDQKPDGSYHVWFDKKAITHTSDSTFILKRKP